jgi:hypothetical protein
VRNGTTGDLTDFGENRSQAMTDRGGSAQFRCAGAIE